jgi:hypothetical protein
MGPVCLTSEMHEISIVSHTVWEFPRTQAAIRGFARLFPRTHEMLHKDRRIWGHSHPTSGSRNKIFVKRLTVLTCVLLCPAILHIYSNELRAVCFRLQSTALHVLRIVARLEYRRLVRL